MGLQDCYCTTAENEEFLVFLKPLVKEQKYFLFPG